MTTMSPKPFDMMKKSPRAPELIQRFVNTADDIAPARYFVRAKKHQKASIERLTALQEFAGEVKQEVVRNGYPKDANLILSIECMIGGLIGELEMIVAIKEERPNSAWDHLLAARASGKAAERAHKVADKLNTEEFLNRLEYYEHLLFPEMQYVSPAFDTGTLICSICEENYANCTHIKGRPYSGEFCTVELRDFGEFDHIALVDEPHSKAHRLTQTPSGRDVMTLLPIEECNPEDAMVSSAKEDESALDEVEDEEKPTVDSELDTLKE